MFPSCYRFYAKPGLISRKAPLEAAREFVSKIPVGGARNDS